MKKFFTTTGFVLSYVLVIAQTTSIPDPNFEQALIDLGYDAGSPDGSVPTANISGVISLSIDNKSISDLTGIEDFSALEFLHAPDNLLTNIDVSQNTSLNHLTLTNNNIEVIDVSQNTALEYLWVSDNPIDSVDITNNPAMLSLQCSFGDSLEHVDISGCSNLVVVGCAGNRLSSIIMDQNTALTELICYDNKINSLDLSQCTSLEILHAYNNELTSIQFPITSSLTEVRIYNNELTSLDVTQNTGLEELYCAQNNITELDLSQNSSLVKIEVGDNDLYCLDVQNGNNTNVLTFFADLNNLGCIQVDDSTYSADNWTMVDPGAYFSTNCGPCSAGIEKNKLSEFSIFPNPMSGSNLTIDLVEHVSEGNIEVYNTLGKLVYKERIKQSQKIKINIQLITGIYILKVNTDEIHFSSKFLVVK